MDEITEKVQALEIQHARFQSHLESERRTHKLLEEKFAAFKGSFRSESESARGRLELRITKQDKQIADLEEMLRGKGESSGMVGILAQLKRTGDSQKWYIRAILAAFIVVVLEFFRDILKIK